MGRARSLVAIIAGLLITALAAGPAHAASVEIGPEETALDGPPAVFEAAPGEVNQLVISSIQGDRNAIVFADAGAAITPGVGCAARDDGSVACRIRGLAGAKVLLEDGDDSLDASRLHDQGGPPTVAGTFYSVSVDGGDGADTLLGADAASTCLHGGPGDDRITAAVTRDAPQRAICGLSGGEGDDRLVGSEADDFLDGGPGQDAIDIGAGDDGARGGSGVDRIDLGAGSDGGGGGVGDDRVTGGSGRDSLSDQEGADLLAGGAGRDSFALDFRHAAGADELHGGSGRDSVKYICPACAVSLDGRADDGPAAMATDNAAQIEQVVTTSERYSPTVEGVVSIGEGKDVLRGNRFANGLAAHAGPDLVVGGRGRDRLVAGAGDDTVRAADGEPDTVDCGGGDDRVSADAEDQIEGCESVRLGSARRALTLTSTTVAKTPGTGVW